jgi:hypothetical protein
MSTTNTKKSGTKRAGLAAALLVSSGLSLIGLGLGAGTAQAEPAPATPHFWQYCEWNDHWYFWDWDFKRHCYFQDYDWHHDKHDNHDNH